MRRGISGFLTLSVAFGCTAMAQDSGVRRTGADDVALRFAKVAPAIGDLAPDVKLFDAKGRLHRLRDLTGRHYTVLVLGCLTCPAFLRNVSGLEALERDYTPKGVVFYYVYKALAHPEHRHYLAPFTMEERLMHIAEAQRTLGSSIPWLADTMTNDLREALGSVPNAELLIDPDGRLVGRRAWSDPAALRLELARFLGPVVPPTRIEDLDMKTSAPTQGVVRGALPPLEVPGPMRALLIEPDLKDSKVPFYMKARVEADRGLLERGDGKLYLGFHLDPLYRVHWNNRAKPLEYELTAPDSVKVSPSLDRAPTVEREVDADPREFLLDLRTEDRTATLRLDVRYFACDDANTFCVPVKQSYTVHLVPDPHAGTVLARTEVNSGKPLVRSTHSPAMRWDINGDGRLTLDEVPEHVQRRFERFDINGDGALDEAEMGAMSESMRGRATKSRRGSTRDPE